MKSLLKQLGQFMLSSASCALGVTANLGIVVLVFPLIMVPSGNSIKPTGTAIVVGVITLCAFSLGIYAALFDVLSGKWKLGFIGFLLCLTPFPLASLLIHLLAFVKGFHLPE